MASTTFQIHGRVIDRTTRRALPDLRIEAWDRDTRFDDLLGIATTGKDGSFRIDFDSSYFADDRVDPYPEIYFRIFDGKRLIDSTEERPLRAAKGRRRHVTLKIDASTARKGAPEPVPGDINKTASGVAPEVSMHELGESISASLANVQHELDRYQSPIGNFVVDEIELNIPVLMRVDEFGQVMVVVTGSDVPTDPTGTQIRLRIKPVLGAHNAPLMAGTQPLSDVTALAPEQADALKQMRVFTVNDLARVTRQAQGRQTVLARMGWDDKLFLEISNQMAILSLPVLPIAVSSVLTRRLQFRTISNFLESDSSMIADVLTAELNLSEENRILPGHVDCWKKETSDYLAVKVPCPIVK